MVKILPDNKKNCCGCAACEQVCPQQCIKLQEDEEGFFYPDVDIEKCIDCGICEKVCPVIKRRDKVDCEEITDPKTIGGWHKDEEIRMCSSSGGAFSLLAQYVLRENGVVFGCTLNQEMKAVHVSIDNEKDMWKLRKSKYVQSDIRGIYSEVEKHLKSRRKVLFVGTPCQCAGLHTFLQNRIYDDLYVCDFICHGVPSPKMFDAYIESLQEEYGSKVIEFSFRNKDAGWKSSGLQMGTQIVFENGTTLRNVPAFKDAFMNGFLDDLFLRPICYECPFKELPKSYADITIADFWGVNKVDKEMNDGKGTSLLLLHSKRAEVLFDCVKEDFHYREYSFEQAIKGNPTLFCSAKENVNRRVVFDDLQKNGFQTVRKKYLSALTWAMHKSINIAWKILKRIMYIFLSFFKINLTGQQEERLLQFVKFGLVGVSNTAISLFINICTLFILRPLFFSYDYVIANFMGFSLSVLWSYAWNSRYVFKLKDGERRSRKKTLFKTYLSYGFSGIILNNCLSTIWINVLGISKFYAPFINIFFTIPVNFGLNKLWAYKSHKSTEENLNKRS